MEKNGKRWASRNEIPLEIIYHTPETFEQLLVTKPWRGYKFLRVEILHDPQKLIQSWKDRIRPWFDDHPDVVELWKQWLDQQKTGNSTRERSLATLSGNSLTKCMISGLIWTSNLQKGILQNHETKPDY